MRADLEEPGSEEDSVNDLDLFAVTTKIADDPTLVRGIAGHVYVVEFGRDRVKVGRTTSPKSRIAAHVRTGRSMDRQVTRLWVSPPHAAYADNERALLKACRDRAGLASNWRGEYFPISAETVMTFVAKLRIERATGAEIAAYEHRMQNTTDVLKGVLLGDFLRRLTPESEAS